MIYECPDKNRNYVFKLHKRLWLMIFRYFNSEVIVALLFFHSNMNDCIMRLKVNTVTTFNGQEGKKYFIYEKDHANTIALYQGAN